jgi:cob(I)alamin adenosyltransferase
MKLYTRKGDDGTTGLLFGGRSSKTAPAVEACGAVDEAQAAIGLARAEAGPGSELDALLVNLERELYALMAELATAPANRSKLTPGVGLVTQEMVDGLETAIDSFTSRFPPLSEFVLPGQDRASALLDVARATVRRAERRAWALGEGLPAAGTGGSLAPVYLNRLSDLLWALARWQEGGSSLRSHPTS